MLGDKTRARNPLRRFAAFALLALVTVAQANDYLIDAEDEFANLFIAGGFTTHGPTHRIQFAPGGYAKPGTLSIPSAIFADTLIFERTSSDFAFIEVTGTLFSLKGLTNTTVILRGLAFQLPSNGKLIEGLVSGSPNHNLIIDSCILFADSLNTTFLSWLGGAGSKVEIRKSMLVIGKSGPNVKLDLQAGIVTLQNNLINFEGVAVISTSDRLILNNNSVNKTQFNLSGGFTSLYTIISNFFLFPPASDHLLVGDTSKRYVSLASNFNAMGSFGNTNRRFQSWTGYANTVGQNLFADASNSPPVTDSAGKTRTTLWDWRIASNTVQGAWNGTTPLPAFNVFPGQTLLAARLSAKDSVEATLVPASIPRVVSLKYDSTNYSETVYANRTQWLKDTVISLTGLASLTSLTFRNTTSMGTPMLFSADSTRGSYTANTPGAEGSLTFVNSLNTAKAFIPTFAGQNTLKGSNVSVTGISDNTLVQFSNISRTGRTTVADPGTFTPRKRFRPLLQGNSSFGLRYKTTAEGSGNIFIGLAKTLATTALHHNDSLIAFDGSVPLPVRDTLSKYWVDLPFADSARFALFERLAIGSGKDTVTFGTRRIVTNTVSGHQLTINTSPLAPTISQARNLGNVEGAVAFQWPGRALGDNLSLTLPKSSPLLAPYLYYSGSVRALTPESEDSTQVTVTLTLSDSAKTVFLARSYPILGDTIQSYKVGQDSLIRFFTKTPASMSFDPDLNVEPVTKDTLTLLVKRRIISENLTLVDSTYRVAIAADSAHKKAENIKAFWVKDSTWEDSLPVTYSNSYWRMDLPKNATGFAIFESSDRPVIIKPPDSVKTDTTPKPDPAKILIGLKLISDTLRLTGPNQSDSFTVEFTPPTARGTVRFKSLTPDSVIVDLNSGLITGIKPGEWPIVVWSVAHVGITDTALVIVAVPAKPDDTNSVAKKGAPIQEISDGKLTLKPNLDSTNFSLLSSYQVVTYEMNSRGEIVKNPIPASPDATVTVTLPTDKLLTYQMNYYSKSNTSTTDSIFYPTPLPTDFTKAVNASAPTYAPLVRYFVGLPVAMKLSDLYARLPKAGSKDPAPEAQAWNVMEKKWFTLSRDSMLNQGKGYLLALPGSVTPKLLNDLNADDLLVPDTIPLQKGWNAIANPKAIPFDTSEIELNDSLVSPFHALTWNGRGPKATYTWVLTDTLKPFLGYAVHAKRATELVFNTMKKRPSKGTGKAASSLPALRLHFAYANGDRAGLYLESKPSHRHAPKSLLGESLKAYWSASQAMIEAAETWPQVNQSLRLFADKPGKVAFTAEGWAQSDTVLALWDSRQGRFLFPGQNDSLLAQPGWNDYRLMALEKNAIATEESRLRAAMPQAFTATMLAKQGRLWFQIPMGLSANASLTLEEFDLHGRHLGGRTWANLTPGSLAWDLSSPRTGLRLVRITFVNGTSVQRQTARAFLFGHKP